MEKPQPSTVLNIICSVFEIQKNDLLSPLRSKRITYARHAAAFVLRNHLQMSFQDIGGVLSRNHATVMHSIRNYQRLILEDNVFQQNMRIVDQEMERIKNAYEYIKCSIVLTEVPSRSPFISYSCIKCRIVTPALIDIDLTVEHGQFFPVVIISHTEQYVIRFNAPIDLRAFKDVALSLACFQSQSAWQEMLIRVARNAFVLHASLTLCVIQSFGSTRLHANVCSRGYEAECDTDFEPFRQTITLF